MQQVSYCGLCNLFSEGQGYLCSNCNNQATVILNPDQNNGFLIDMSNEGHIYFHDIADFNFKDKIIQKLIKMSLEKRSRISYIN